MTEQRHRREMAELFRISERAYLEHAMTERRLRRERAETFRLSERAFAALCVLTSARNGAVTSAVRAAVVEGLPIDQAAEQAGIAEQSLRNALVRYRKAHELAKEVAAG